jgi:hypothetical protein
MSPQNGMSRDLKPRAMTAGIPSGFAVLVREAKRARKPGASPSLLRLPNQGGAVVAVKPAPERGL